MKKVIYLFIIGCLMTSCADVTQALYKSEYQRQNLIKFGKKRNYQKASARYVPFRKKGAPHHPMVTKQTRKAIKQQNQ